MTIEQIQEKIQELFGDSVADPEHYPTTFSYQVKLAAWMLQQEQPVKSTDSQ